MNSVVELSSKYARSDAAQALQHRTKQLALRIIRMLEHLPRTDTARTIGRQVLRSSTSTAANYRAVCRVRSHAEFSAKLGTVVEEADETVFWLELLDESGIVSSRRLASLTAQATELRAILAAGYRTARMRSAADRKRAQSTNQQVNKSTSRRS